MLHNLEELLKCRVVAEDGGIGKVRDVFFDDQSGAMRYLVVDTGTGYPDSSVMIPLAALDRSDWRGHELSVRLDRASIFDIGVTGAHTSGTRPEAGGFDISNSQTKL